jgi:hypothetical protein
MRLRTAQRGAEEVYRMRAKLTLVAALILGAAALTLVPGAGASNGPGALNCPLPQYLKNPTHYALAVGTQVTCTIDDATDVSNGDVTIFVKTSMGNDLVTGSASEGTITFSYTAPSNGCSTSIVAYGTPGNNTNASLLGHPNSAAGLAFVGPGGVVTECGGTVPPAANLSVTKSADGSINKTFTWGITKSVDKTLVEQVGGTATFNYVVSVTHDDGAESWQDTGNISVSNPNTADVTGVDVTDSIDDANATCSVTGGTAAVIPAASIVDFPYTCSYSSAGPANAIDTNTGTAIWGAQTVDGAPLAAGTASGQAAVTWANVTPITVDGSVTVTDPLGGGTLGTVSSTDPSPTSFHYFNTVPVPAHNCTTIPNTATFTTSDTQKTGSANQSVEVCGPALTGGLTIGFWQNKNGQKIISSASQSALSTWLKGFHPFSNAPSSGLAAYVANIINAATCGGSTCNTMLRAQMLATALNVYFSDPALGGNQIGAPAPIGGVVVDLTKICTNIPTCSSFENDSSVFGGASSLSINAILLYQNTSDPVANAGAVWYLQNKANQVRAKDVFDAINNQVVFAP